jgi:hypothetical protein
MNKFDILSFKPILIDNFFTEEHINHITEFINSQINKNINNKKEMYSDFEKNEKLGCFTYSFKKDEIIATRDYVSEQIKKILNFDIHSNSIDLKYQRYTPKTGNYSPELKPHVDRIDQTHYMSFSLPINNKEVWPIYLDRKKYVIKNNQALFFNVSNTIHWRPKKEFLEDQYYDVLILRFYDRDNRILVEPDLLDKLENKRISILSNSYY